MKYDSFGTGVLGWIQVELVYYNDPDPVDLINMLILDGLDNWTTDNICTTHFLLTDQDKLGKIMGYPWVFEVSIMMGG